LNWADAQKMVAAAKTEAVKNQWKVSVAVVDEAGYLIHVERMDGAVLQSRTSPPVRPNCGARPQSHQALEDMTKDRPVMMVFPDRLPLQGGLPILHENQCIGGIGVSGVKSHEDEQVAAAGIAALGA